MAQNLEKKLGEPPVLLDTNLAQLSAENIANHLFNMGYFDVQVSYHTTLGHRKAHVVYDVLPGKAYRLNSFFRQPADTALKPLIDSLVAQNIAYRLWWPINLNDLNAAKEELTLELRDRGYFEAQPDLFHYEIDTLQNKKRRRGFLKLDNPNAKKNSNATGLALLISPCSVLTFTRTTYILKRITAKGNILR